MKECVLCGGNAGILAARYSKDKVWVCWNCAMLINLSYNMRELKLMSAEQLKQAYTFQARALETASKKSEEHAVEMWSKLGYCKFPSTERIGNFLWLNDENKEWIAPKDIKEKLGLYRGSTIYKYSDIRSFELLEDGTTITSGGLGSAVVGGILFGGAGAIVGGVTGGKTANEFCSKLQIKITLNNLSNPVEYINLIKFSTRRSSSEFKKAYDSAQKILSVLQIICNTEAREENSSRTNSFSVADEVRKFKELLDIGAITQEEYDFKKKQLLGF